MSELDSRAEAVDRALAEEAMRKRAKPTTPSVLVDTLAIAAVFADMLKYYVPIPSDDYGHGKFLGIARSAVVIAEAIQPTNMAFDKRAFLKLCGVPE